MQGQPDNLFGKHPYIGVFRTCGNALSSLRQQVEEPARKSPADL